MLVFVAAPIAPSFAQDIGDPWLDSLRGATGTVIGDLNPRFDDGPSSSSAPPGDAAPGTVNPSDRETARLIREWIDIAEPPQNVTEGARLHYTYGGNMVGTTADGGIIASPHESGAFDPVFLWQNRRGLDSVDHCTMEEYVVARLAEEPVDGCRGRYRPGGPVAGNGNDASGDTGDRIEDAISACRFDEARTLIDAIGDGSVRARLERRYTEAHEREEKTKALFAEGDAAYRNCDFDEASESLDKAAANTNCDRYRTRIAQAASKVAAAQAHEEKTRALFSEADRLFRQNDFETARSRLETARAHTRCQRYVTRIDEALGKVVERIAQAPPASPPPVEAPAPPAPAVSAGADYFIGVWAMSPTACSGPYKPRPRDNSETAGSIAGAIEQGVEQGLEIAAHALRYEFRSNGVFYVRDIRQPNSRFVPFADWSVRGDVMTFHTYDDDETDTARILRKLPDRFEIDSEVEGENASFYRCTEEPN
ncbi:hypothetical protein [Roseibium sp. Sym1]|uniref:hypothetical protein n=1 Tax=Roseibium sp. Sym1 TaxID=3016006 RepID=UPI0022B2BDBF|nr:hypothetical protein [Roseibium sp. Sym1]